MPQRMILGMYNKSKIWRGNEKYDTENRMNMIELNWYGDGNEGKNFRDNKQGI